MGAIDLYVCSRAAPVNRTRDESAAGQLPTGFMSLRNTALGARAMHPWRHGTKYPVTVNDTARFLPGLGRRSSAITVRS